MLGKLGDQLAHGRLRGLVQTGEGTGGSATGMRVATDGWALTAHLLHRGTWRTPIAGRSQRCLDRSVRPGHRHVWLRCSGSMPNLVGRRRHRRMSHPRVIGLPRYVGAEGAGTETVREVSVVRDATSAPGEPRCPMVT